MKPKIRQLLIAIGSLLLGTNAFAHDFEVDGIYYNILSSNTVEVTFQGDSYNSYSDEYTGTVTIPSTVTYSETTYSVTAIGDNAFMDCADLTSVTIPKSVTSIGNSAFMFCAGLTSVTIPDGITEIGYNAFYNCSGLTEATIPDSVTKIGQNAFAGTGWYNNQSNGILYLDNCCLGYKGDAPTGELSLNEGTRLIGDYAFYGCSSLTSVTIPDGVTEIGDFTFQNCSGLTSVSIPKSVTSIGDYAFYGCI